MFCRTFSKFAALFLGIFLTALGSVFMIQVEHLGLQPVDSMYVGLHQKTSISIGSWSIMLAAGMVVVSIAMTKEKLKIGTILEAIFLGIFIDVILHLNFIHNPNTIELSILYFLIGTTCIAFGVSIVILTNLGAGPHEMFILAVSKTCKWSIQKASTSVEICALVVAFLVEGPINIGTLVFCLSIGPLIQFFVTNGERISLHLKFPHQPKKEINMNSTV